MATTTKEKTDFKPVRLFNLAKDLGVVTDKIVAFLKENDYGDALSGRGPIAKVTAEEAYLAVREEFASDAEAAARLRELRAEQGSAEGPDRDEVASIGAEQDQQGAEEAELPQDEEERAASEVVAGDEPPAEGESAAGEAVADETMAEASGDGAMAETAPADESTDEEEAGTEEEEAPEATSAATPEDGPQAAPAETGEAKTGEADVVAEEEDRSALEAATPESTDAAAPEEEQPASEASQAEPAQAESPPQPEAAEQPEATAAEATAAEATSAEAKGAASRPEAAGTAEPSSTDEPTEEPADEAEAAGVADEAEAKPEATAPEQEAATSDQPEGEADVESAQAESAEAESAEAESAQAAEGEKKEDGDVLRGDRYKLKGASVVGKVDLSKFKRRKRKRKQKKKEKKESKQRSRDKGKKKGGGKSSKSRKPDEQDVEERLQDTLRELEQGASRVRQRRRQRRRERHAAEREAERERRKARENVLRVTEYVSTGELANLMGEPVNDVIATLFEAGMMVSINQRLDADAIDFVADEYGYDVEFTNEYALSDIEVEEDAEEDLVPRAPVVTVMGHVDHGKTSLLDFVRHENVVGGEAGGITQHIGAYKVTIDSGDQVTFLDTPGHEAFTAMRARGAKATDVVILVVAADDAVMPQTKEAINHAQAADVPIVVAINKMDLPEADEGRVMQQLAEEGVLVEQYGGEVQCALVSAETGDGIGDLLEKVVLESELRELKANPNRVGSGVVIESHLEKGRGNVVTALIKNGTLRVGDPFIAGVHSGRVRAMFNEHDQRIDEVGPSEPALVLGSNGSPEVGDQFVVFEDESEARDIAQQRQQIHREQRLRQKKHVTLDEIGRRLALGEFHELNLVIKGDVSGSVEALSDALMELRTEEVAVNVVHSGAGAVTESDIMLAAASDAVVIAFQVRPTRGARQLAKQEEIDIRTYSIIYDAIEEVRDALEGMLSPEEREESLGHAEVREIFKVPNVGTVAGCRVTEGRINRNDQVRVVRDGVVMYEGRLGSLKHHQDDVREIQNGYECGLSVANYDDIKVGDEIESYRVEEIARTLEGV